MAITYSVVIPLKNEESNIIDLIDELEPVMQGLQRPWELICIDDGSTDQTAKILGELAQKKSFLRPLIFDRNYGQSSAFDAGFKAAQGEFVITLDGDRQNDPRDIPKMVELIKESDMVCGIRQKRRDSFVKRVTSRLANFVRSRLCQDGVEDTGCSLKIYRTTSLRRIKMYHGMHRFLPALFTIEGFSIMQVPVNHRERTKGTSNYNFFNRSFNTISDMFAVRWMKKRHLNYKIQNSHDK
jgi:dolichol-phosphate mannosyltransferase